MDCRGPVQAPVRLHRLPSHVSAPATTHPARPAQSTTSHRSEVGIDRHKESATPTACKQPGFALDFVRYAAKGA